VAERRKKRSRKAGDGLEGDFGPGFEPAADASDRPAGGRASERDGAGRAADFAAGFAGIPCGKDGCFLKPVGDLVTRFALELARRGHADSATRAATSGIELLRALRDFLDEEIAFAERAAEKQRAAARYTKIPVE
jgi:hypothetical protein